MTVSQVHAIRHREEVLGNHLLHTVQALPCVGETVAIISVQQVAFSQIPQLEHVMADLPPVAIHLLHCAVQLHSPETLRWHQLLIGRLSPVLEILQIPCPYAGTT